MKHFNNSLSLKKFSQYLIAGFFCFILLFLAYQVIANNFFKKNPGLALASNLELVEGGLTPPDSFELVEGGLTPSENLELVEGGLTPPENLELVEGGLTPPSCTETRETFGQCGGTVGLEGLNPTHAFEIAKFTNVCTGAERFEFVRDAGEQAACGGAPAFQPAPQPSFCPVDRSDQYPQCGGTLGLEDKDPTHTFMVTRVRDCNGNVIGYESSNLGNLGQCGVAEPTPVCRDTHAQFPQCGGTVGLENFPDTDTILVDKFTDSCTGAERFGVARNLGNLGQCAALPTPLPTAIPTRIPTPIPTAIPTAIPTPTVILPTPIVVTPTAAPTPTIIVPTIIPQGQVNTVQCPAGFDRQIVDSNIICIQQVQNQAQNQTSNSVSSATTAPINITVVGATPAAQVAGVSMAKADILPQTGLPIAAWAVSGLAPIGLGLKRFRKVNKATQNSAYYLWQEREFFRS